MNNTNKDSYFRAVTFTPLSAEEGQDEKQYDENDDSYMTYSYEYVSSEDYNDPQKNTNSDKKLFRSSKIAKATNSDKKLIRSSKKGKATNSDKKLFSSTKIVMNKGDRKGKDYDKLEEEALFRTLKEGAPSRYNQEDYKLDSQEDDLKTKKEEFEGSIERSKEEPHLVIALFDTHFFKKMNDFLNEYFKHNFELNTEFNHLGLIERIKQGFLVRRGGSDESRPSWGLAAFDQSEDEDDEQTNHDYGDTRSSFSTFATALSLFTEHYTYVQS